MSRSSNRYTGASRTSSPQDRTTDEARRKGRTAGEPRAGWTPSWSGAGWPARGSRPPSWSPAAGSRSPGRPQKAATQVETAAPHRRRADDDGPDYVSRGGHKLAGALDAFAPPGWRRRAARCLDAGASTGGFTDVLLRRGRRARRRRRRRLRPARLVAADRRRGSRCVDRTNVRDLTPDAIGEPVDLVVGRPVVHLAAPGAARAACACADPGRRPRADGEAAVRGGPGAARRGRCRARPGAARGGRARGGAAAARQPGLGVAGVTASPLPGPGGQRGVLPLAAARRPGAGPTATSTQAVAGGTAVTPSRAAACCSSAHTGRAAPVAVRRSPAERFAGGRRRRPGAGRRGRRSSACADADGRRADPSAAEGCELVIVLGGDGTLLRAAELARPAGRRCSGSTSATSASSPRPSGTDSTRPSTRSSTAPTRSRSG